MGRWSGIVVLLIAVLFSVAVADDSFGPLPANLRAWKLAFVRDHNIWVANGDGTDQKLIVENGQNPSWFHDKSAIAFVRDNTIWVAMADGSKQRPVTSGWKGHDSDLSTSFPGVEISCHPKNDLLTFSHPEVFQAERVDKTEGVVPRQNSDKGVIAGSSLFEVRLDAAVPGKAVVRYDLFKGGTSFFFPDNAHPAWSPTGDRLAFTRNGDIWIAEMEKDSEGGPPVGWDVKRLAAVATYDEPTNRGSRSNFGATRLSWHPNGRLLAYGYERLQGSGFNEIHLLDTITGKSSVIAKDALHPGFSPDGNFIVYWTYSHELCGKMICICAVSSDGRKRQKLVENGKDPVW
jgi:Tol biopolymer transport system component